MPIRSIAPSTAATSVGRSPVSGARGQAAQRHDLLDRHRERQVGELGYDRDRPGELLARHLVDGLAEQVDRAGAGREHPGQCPEQRGLARSVRSDQREPLPGRDR
jgi:hypothetical protein